MGPFRVTPSNPTHQLTDPTQPNSLQVEKFGPNQTQPNTANNGTYSFALYTLHLPTFRVKEFISIWAAAMRPPSNSVLSQFVIRCGNQLQSY